MTRREPGPDDCQGCGAPLDPWRQCSDRCWQEVRDAFSEEFYEERQEASTWDYNQEAYGATAIDYAYEAWCDLEDAKER
jgi:hypothetical protein